MTSPPLKAAVSEHRVGDGHIGGDLIGGASQFHDDRRDRYGPAYNSLRLDAERRGALVPTGCPRDPARPGPADGKLELRRRAAAV